MSEFDNDAQRDPHEAAAEDRAINGYHPPTSKETAAALKDEAPIEGEVTQPQAAPPTPASEPKQTMTIRDTGKTKFMDPNLYIQMKAMANDFIDSKALAKCWETPTQVLIGLQTGLEMGMQPMEAMNSLYFVNGAINVWGKATTKRIKDHGWYIKYSDESQETCTATIWKGKSPVKPAAADEQYTETFTFKEAEESGYTTDSYGKLKIGWRAGMNRRKKLRYGVLALIINTYIPEVLGSAIGIVEVSDDYDLGTNANPAQLVDNKTRIAAAEAKRKELSSGNFKPSAVTAAAPTTADKE